MSRGLDFRLGEFAPTIFRVLGVSAAVVVFVVPLLLFQNCNRSKPAESASSPRALRAPTADIALSGIAQSHANSILQYFPGGGVPPAAQIVVSTFGNEESLASNTGLDFDQRSSLQNVVSRGAPNIKAKFRSEISAAFPPNTSPPHPACGGVLTASAPTLVFHSYVKPYTYRQGDFLGWVHANSGIDDILPPAARKLNGYRGNQECPWGAGGSLLGTFGYSAFSDANQISLHIDNRINPWRWNAPLNTIHPVEQPSFAAITKAKDSETLQQTKKILSAFRNGDQSQHLYLDYEIDFSVYDARQEMNESTILGLYEGHHPSEINTLFGMTHWYSYLYGRENGVYNYALKRYIAPSVQLSLMVNFREDGKAWLENEFMLSSFNYSSTVPDATNNPTINQYIFEGGTNEALASWYRLRVDALRLPSLLTSFPNNPIVVSGGNYVPIEFDSGRAFKSTLSGRIDLTAYYLVSRAHGFFPGQKADLEQSLGENNAINWLGLIVENHGPFVVDVKARKLNISVDPFN